VISGRFEDLRTAFNRVSDDPRIQGIIIAFCFGGLLEALAGFGAPVAITGVMLVSLGFSAMRAAATVLLANTAPVAFGAIGIPIITAGNLTGIDYNEIGAVVGRQTPLLAAFVPLLLVIIVDGKRGIQQTWPVALVAGIAFAIAQFVSSNYISVELTDIIASLVALVAVVAMLRFWKPKGSEEARERLAIALKEEHVEPVTGTAPVATAVSTEKLTVGRTVMAFLPYLVVIVVFTLAKLWAPLKTWLAGTDVKIPWRRPLCYWESSSSRAFFAMKRIRSSSICVHCRLRRLNMFFATSIAFSVSNRSAPLSVRNVKLGTNLGVRPFAAIMQLNPT